MRSYLETSEAPFLRGSHSGERGSGLGANAKHVSDGRSATYAPHAAPSPSVPAFFHASKVYGEDREASEDVSLHILQRMACVSWRGPASSR